MDWFALCTFRFWFEYSFWAWKVTGTFEKRAPAPNQSVLDNTPYKMEPGDNSEYNAWFCKNEQKKQ